MNPSERRSACAALSPGRSRRRSRSRSTAAVVSLGSSAAVLSLYFLLFRAFAGAPDSAALYFFGYLPRVLYTAMTFVPLYGLNRLITKRL